MEKDVGHLLKAEWIIDMATKWAIKREKASISFKTKIVKNLKLML